MRDHKINLLYFGWISYYADAEKDRELIIDEVGVYDLSGELLYSSPSMYLSRNKFDLTIEKRYN